MSKAKKPDDLGKKLEAAVVDMLNHVSGKVDGKTVDMELRLKVFDRAAKYYQIKMKVADTSLGAGFREDDEQET